MKHWGVVIGDKLERRNQLDSDVMLAEMTRGEEFCSTG